MNSVDDAVMRAAVSSNSRLGVGFHRQAWSLLLLHFLEPLAYCCIDSKSSLGSCQTEYVQGLGMLK